MTNSAMTLVCITRDSNIYILMLRSEYLWRLNWVHTDTNDHQSTTMLPLIVWNRVLMVENGRFWTSTTVTVLFSGKPQQGAEGARGVEGCCMTSHVNKNALRFCFVYSQTLTHYLQQHVNTVVLD